MFIVLSLCVMFFFFKQKTAYELRISDWSSDVCSSDLEDLDGAARERKAHRGAEERRRAGRRQEGRQDAGGKAAAQAMRRAVRLALSTSDGREATHEAGQRHLEEAEQVIGEERHDHRQRREEQRLLEMEDRKSTRLNS